MPPQVPAPMVALELPRNNKLMRTIIDKMSKISRNVHLSASQCTWHGRDMTCTFDCTTPTQSHSIWLFSKAICYRAMSALDIITFKISEVKLSWYTSYHPASFLFPFLLSFHTAGRITFRVEHSTATIKTFYNGLQARLAMIYKW